MGPKRKARAVKETGPTAEDVEASRLAEEDCVICYDKMGEDTATLGCAHSFCFKCIDHWRKTENSCPLCKTRFASISRLRKVRNKFKKVTVRVAARQQGPPVMRRTNNPGAALFALLFNHLWAHERRRHGAFEENIFGDDDDDDEDEDEEDEEFVLDDILGTPNHPIYIDFDEVDVAMNRPIRPFQHGMVIDLTNDSEDEVRAQQPAAPRPSVGSSSSSSSSSSSMESFDTSAAVRAPHPPYLIDLPARSSATFSGQVIVDVDAAEANHSSADQRDISADQPPEPPRKRARRT